MKTEKNAMLLHLMQNVSDKLEENSKLISELKVTQLDEKALLPLSDSNQAIFKAISDSIDNQNNIKVQAQKLSKHLENEIKNTAPIVNKEENKQLIIFGKDTPFTSKILLIVIVVLFIGSFGFKYVPGYITENSKIKLERDHYKLFYQYVYLNTYNNNQVKAEEVANKMRQIENTNPSLLKNIEDLRLKYSNQIKKENLQKKLDELENNNDN